MSDHENKAGVSFFLGSTAPSLTKEEIKEARQRWRTPSSIVSLVQNKLGLEFVLDLCADSDNICAEYITKEDDLFKADVKSRFLKAKREYIASGGLRDSACWMNPPYGDVGPFLEKAREVSSELGIKVVILIKADPSVKWWQKNVWTEGTKILFPTKRISFTPPIKGIKFNNPPFASAIVVFSPADENMKGHPVTCEPLEI